MPLSQCSMQDVGAGGMEAGEDVVEAIGDGHVVVGGVHFLGGGVGPAPEVVVGEEVVDLGLVGDADHTLDEPVAGGGVGEREAVNRPLLEVGPLTETVAPFGMRFERLREVGDVAPGEVDAELHPGGVGGVGEGREAVGEGVGEGPPLGVFPAEVDDEEFDAELGADVEALAHGGVVDLVVVAPGVEGDVGEAFVGVDPGEMVVDEAMAAVRELV